MGTEEDLDQFVRSLQKLMRANDRKFAQHLEFLSQLQWSMIIFNALAIIAWIILQYKVARTYFKKKARHPRNDIVIKLNEQEKGEAQYLLTFFTQGDYSDATTAVTTVHLISEAFPGRIHDIPTVCKARELYQMFAPLCTEKIIVREDVELDPIIGLTIKTNQYGMHPVWHCTSIIVRNLLTNNAWYFKLSHREISFAQAIRAQPAHGLLTLKFSFDRRLRREYRNGQHIYLGFWAWSPSSVYSTVQRIVVTLVTHSCLICFCLVGLNVAFPLGYESTRGYKHDETKSEKNVKGQFGVKAFGWSLEGETFITVWLYEILLSAVLAGFVTTFLGLIMVMHFRQQRVYERTLGEMDYVVATALRQISMAKRTRAAMAGTRKENVKNASKLTDFTALLKTRSRSSAVYHNPWDATISEPDEKMTVLYDAMPLEILGLMSPAEARARQRSLFIGQNHLDDPRYAKFLKLPPIIVDNCDFLGGSLLAENYRRHYGGIDLPIQSKKNATMTVTTSSTSVIEAGQNDHHRHHHHHRHRHSSKSKTRFYREVYFRNRTNFQKANSGMPDLNPGFHVVVPELAMPFYLVDEADERHGGPCAKDQLPRAQNSAKRFRPWYRPYSAWVVTIILMLTSIAGTVCISVLVPVTKVHPGLYFLILVTTYLSAVTLSYAAFEPIKIVLIAIFYAYNDRKIHEDIQDKSIIPHNIEFQYQH